MFEVGRLLKYGLRETPVVHKHVLAPEKAGCPGRERFACWKVALRGLTGCVDGANWVVIRCRAEQGLTLVANFVLMILMSLNWVAVDFVRLRLISMEAARSDVLIIILDEF